LSRVRRIVFIDEQRVPENLEWDEVDPACVHAIAESAAGAAIGCGRLLPDGHVGRMAVLAPWRGRGVGDALLTRLVEAARERGHARVILNAQVQAMPFYARHGFAPQGEAFEEAGIAHQVMTRTLR
jgi:predicted GNAT family N-acyltransferase